MSSCVDRSKCSPSASIPSHLSTYGAASNEQSTRRYGISEGSIFRNAIEQQEKQVIVSSGSRLRREIAEAFIRQFPSVQYLAQGMQFSRNDNMKMHSGFGMTEVGFTHLPLLREQCSADTVGAPVKEYEQKVQYSCVRFYELFLQIMDINRPRECGPDELGELCLRGSAVTAGYLNKERETRELIDEEGWAHTGGSFT